MLPFIKCCLMLTQTTLWIKDQWRSWQICFLRKEKKGKERKKKLLVLYNPTRALRLRLPSPVKETKIKEKQTVPESCSVLEEWSGEKCVKSMWVWLCTELCSGITATEALPKGFQVSLVTIVCERSSPARGKLPCRTAAVQEQHGNRKSSTASLDNGPSNEEISSTS